MESKNIFSIFSTNVSNSPNKVAVYLQNNKYTYQELYNLVSCSEWNIQEGSHVAVLLENTIEFVVLLLLASKNNFVLVPFSPNTPEKQLQKLFIDNDIDLLISQTGVKVIKASQKRKNDNYIIVSTSGSTSLPKPIVLTEEIKLNRIASAQYTYNLNSEDVILVSTPMHHSLAQRGVLLPLVLGATTVIMGKFSPTMYLSYIRSYAVSFSFAVSNQLEAIVSCNCENITSLKTIVSSSYSLKKESKLKLIEKLNCDLCECYGTSEIGCATNLTSLDMLTKTESVGCALDGVHIEIINATNGIGEIAVKTPMRFKEYYKKNKETALSFQGDSFKTGDLGYLKDGFLYYIGRTKDVIKTGAISVYPIDIENAINEVDGVKECAVIGIEDEYFGEVIVAIVSGEVTKKILREACSLALSPYQLPMHYEIVDEIPKNQLGKIQKFHLKEQYNHLQIGKKLKGLI